MKNYKVWLGGILTSCLLSSPAAFADDYSRFYLSAWGGIGDAADLPSKSAYDAVVANNLAAEVAAAPGNATLTGVDGSSSLDDSLNVWGLSLGFRFNKYVAAEFGYVDLGEWLYQLGGTVSGTYAETQSDGSVLNYALNGRIDRATQVTSTGITGSVLGMFAINPKFDLHGRLGLYMADTRVTDRLRYLSGPVTNLAHNRSDASQTEIFAGVGAAWNINESFTLRVEYQKFFDVGDDDKTSESDIDVISVGLLFR